MKDEKRKNDRNRRKVQERGEGKKKQRKECANEEHQIVEAVPKRTFLVTSILYKEVI